MVAHGANDGAAQQVPFNRIDYFTIKRADKVKPFSSTKRDYRIRGCVYPQDKFLVPFGV
jgi:hypothetical protein